MKEALETSDDNYLKLESQMKIEDIHKNLLHKFCFLNEENELNMFYKEYADEGTEDDKKKIEIWDKIICYLLTEIFHSFAFKIPDIISYLKIHDKEPIIFQNILKKLRIHQIYITGEDLNNDNYYKMNFPNLYPETPSFVNSLFNGVTSYLFPKNENNNYFDCCKEKEKKDKIDIGDDSLRKDLTEMDKIKNIPETSIIFNYEIFKSHCNKLLMIIKDILHDKDTKVIKKEDLIENINSNYTENNNDEFQGFNFKLHYGIQYINYAFHYLEKIKEIKMFDFCSIEFIKVLENKDDSIKNEDKEEAELIISK